MEHMLSLYIAAAFNQACSILGRKNGEDNISGFLAPNDRTTLHLLLITAG